MGGKKGEKEWGRTEGKMEGRVEKEGWKAEGREEEKMP